MTEPSWHFTIDAVATKLPGPAAEFNLHYALRHGSMRIGLYAPRQDRQTPHKQDELYIVAAGSGSFEKDGITVSCGVNDVLFVEAGRPHRFCDTSEDFAAWVVFYGPEGGENSSA